MPVKTNILCVVERTNDAMAWYRSVLPMVRLMQDNDDINCQWMSSQVNPDWDMLSQYRIVYCHKPHSKEHVELLSRAKAMKMKIWIDIDDEVWSLTSDHPAYNYHNDKNHLLRLQESFGLADVITTSTNHLSQKTRDFVGSHALVFTVENACDIHGLQAPKKVLNPRSNDILWRGSYTHQKDLFDCKDAIIEIDQERSDLRWMFMGYNPFFITDSLREFTFVDHMPLTEFFGTMNKLPGHISIVPLTDTSFNRSKSPIAALEAVVAGRIPICESWWEMTHEDMAGKSFRDKILYLMDCTDDELLRIHKFLMDKLYENHNLHVVNKQRLTVIKGL